MPTTEINGFDHHWEELGSGQALIMLHGAVSSGKHLIEHAKELSADFRVLVPDMRGMGQSQRISSIPTTAWVDDLKGLLDHLGLSTAHIFGTGLGTRVALRFTIEHPEMTSSLILDESIIAFDEAGGNAMNTRLSDLDSLPPETVRQYEFWHGSNWKEAIQPYFPWRNESATHEYFNLREPSKDITVPTLITRGDAREPIHPMSHSNELFENIKTARLWIKPEGGCFATPEGYAMVRSFIADAVKQPVKA